MRKWMFVCAVVTLGSFLADPASAQAQSSAPAVVTSEMATPAQRGGLFSRLRNRRQMTPVSQPVLATPMTTTQTTPLPSGIQQAQALEPAATTTPATTTTTIAPTTVPQTRQGLLSRLRLRR